MRSLHSGFAEVVQSQRQTETRESLVVMSFVA